ncbi:right-handed parallel beta-helix repeat-containing protein [Heyndrickxia oleronia]|uniref:right-handed parallel beta-helix repeat-containing protein n=1 Tax=Heyndrickxia oleronia TaxID=38875 RepID=UPI0024316E86|nr:right-handed parallel beta-helix repeat-containing protein [Heyndrickxia oleronia]MCI1763651.1 right-handed parallel beta-helix repeat-containing protein [Heyndrickxia oleronia]
MNDQLLHGQIGSGKGGSSSSNKIARFVIGTSIAGWTSQEVDYLCDGTSDQEEINNAIQALPESGGEIIILDGIYFITGHILVDKNNVSLWGNGSATVIKRMYDNTVLGGLITLTNVEYCKVSNLMVDGNDYSASLNVGIYLDFSLNCSISGNICSKNARGIYLDNGNNNIIATNTCNGNSGTGIYLSSSSSSTITGNTCNSNSSGTGLTINVLKNSSITGNTCIDNKGAGITSMTLKNSSITGNTCIDNGTDGIYLSSSSNNTVVGNTCIRGNGTATDYTVSQNTIRLNSTGNNYNLISSNNCMGKDIVIGGGTANTSVNNKFQ